LGALYRVTRLADDTFSVVVTIAGAKPVSAPGFASEELAKAWIASHQRDVAAGTAARAKLHLWNEST
jgi:hypothetical protein